MSGSDPISFRPAWWCSHPQLQTLWATVAFFGGRVKLRRERLELRDGDFVDLDWTPGSSGPIVIVLHGLQGSSRSHYVRRLLDAVHERGWRGVVLHFRGCSGVPNRLVRAYHAGDTHDLDFLVDTLRQREPRAQIGIVGYSLGGNVLLKWLGEAGARASVQAAVAVCVPLSLDVAARRLNKGLSRIYQWGLIKSSIRSIKRKCRHGAVPFELEELCKIRTCWEFDDKVTAPMFGFRDAAHYYETASARRYLKGIAARTLIIQSFDDPFMTREVIPSEDELSPCTELEVHSGGGHVGFVTGRWPWAARYWLNGYVPHRLAQCFAAADAERTALRFERRATLREHESNESVAPTPLNAAQAPDASCRRSA